MIENNILGVVLAGGKSQRFGSDKSFAKLGNKTLVEHTISKIENNFKEILIISNHENFNIKKKNVFLTKDIVEGYLGPLIGVLSAMDWVEKNKRDYKWIATFPCDTPFFDKNIVDNIKSFTKKNKKLFFLKSGKRRHNIFGLWSTELKRTLSKVKTSLISASIKV